MKKVITIITLITIIATLNRLVFNVGTKRASSIGIIGGADGPTTIFLTNHLSNYIVTGIFIILSVAGIVYLLLSKK